MFTVANRYHVVRSLGSGGMGAVYEAVHSGTGRRVAVKLLHHHAARQTTDRERFEREARLSGSFTSPNVVHVYDAGVDDVSSLPYIAMELVDGPSLRELLERRSMLPPGLVLVIAAQVARGLTEAHEAEVIHRDVKPANVMLTRDAEGRLLAKLVDFGVARSISGDTITTTGAFVGSLPYMSPEQMSGKPVDPTTDIWSLGALMYEALSGQRASGDTSAAISELVRRVCYEDAPPLTEAAPWVPRGVAQIVCTAMHRERERRFPSARAMERAILALLPAGATVDASAIDDGSNIVVAEPTALEDGARIQPPEPRRRRFWFSALGLAAVTATFGIAAGVNRLAHADGNHGRDRPRDVHPSSDAPVDATTPRTSLGSSPAAPSEVPPPLEAQAVDEPANLMVGATTEDRPSAPPSATAPVAKKRPRKLSPTAEGPPSTVRVDPLDHM